MFYNKFTYNIQNYSYKDGAERCKLLFQHPNIMCQPKKIPFNTIQKLRECEHRRASCANIPNTHTQLDIKYLKNGNIMLTKGGIIRVMSVIIMQHFPCLYVISSILCVFNIYGVLYIHFAFFPAGVCIRINYEKGKNFHHDP